MILYEVTERVTDLNRGKKDSRNEEVQADSLFFQIFESMREKNPDFPMDYVLSQLPEFTSISFRIKNYFTGVVACLTALWTERVVFENKQKHPHGEGWEEITSREFISLVEKVASDFRENPELTHHVLSYIDASNVDSRVFRLYIDIEDHGKII